MPPSARDRAEAELRAEPARSDATIAAAANCTKADVYRWRQQLERAGTIPVVSPSRRRHGPAWVTTDVPAAPFYIPSDPATERTCCVMEWSGGAFVHERSCALRLAAR